MATVGVHTVTVTPSGGGAVDASCYVLDLDIRGGRDGPDGQPDAATVTLNVTARPDLATTYPDALEVGASLVVKTGTSVRFTGTITDMALGWEDDPDTGVGQVIAVGALADLGRVVVGDVPFPQELDGARVSRIMAAAGITLNPATSDPGTVQILARDIDSTPALDTAQGTASSASGVVWATRAGEVRYADADHRKSAAVDLNLDACNVQLTPTWRRTTEGLVNSVSVGYGVTPEGGEQPRYVASRADSIAKYKTHGYSIQTELAALADATALGEMLLVRNSSPVWVMADLPVDVASLTDAEYTSLLALEMHSLVNLTGLPSVGGTPSNALLWVEGWAEHLAYGVHEIDLIVSGYCRTAPAPTWNTVDPSWVWGGQTWTEQRRNLCTNPSFEVSTAGWGVAGGATTALDTARAVAGSQSCKVTHAAGAANASLLVYTMSGLTVGQVYSIAASVWVPAGGVDHGLRVTGIGGVAGSSIRDAWFRPSFTFTATATTHTAYVGATAPTTAGMLVWVDAFTHERAASAGSYFDGDTPDTANEDYAWAGAPGASVSTYSTSSGITPGIDPSLTWDTMTCLGPPTNYGRWDDQPSTLRWDGVPAATTWDTFTGG